MANNSKKKSGVALGKWLPLIFTFGVRLVFAYLFWIRRYAKHPEKKSIEYRYKKVRALALDLTKRQHLRVKEKGKEYVSSLEGNNLIVCNHLSVMDIVMLICYSEKPLIFIAKKEVEQMPFVGKLFQAISGYFLDREDPKQAVRLFMKVGKQLRENGGNVVVYPEGTRLKEPFKPTQEFHAGSFKLVEWGQANLIRVALFGTFRPLTKSEHPRSFPIEITFFPPVKYEDMKGKNTQEIAEESHKLIAEEVASFQEFDKDFYAQGLDKKRVEKFRP